MNKPSVKRERIDPSRHHKDCGGLDPVLEPTSVGL